LVSLNFNIDGEKDSSGGLVLTMMTAPLMVYQNSLNNRFYVNRSSAENRLFSGSSDLFGGVKYRILRSKVKNVPNWIVGKLTGIINRIDVIIIITI
jgi:hypothetical protein